MCVHIKVIFNMFQLTPYLSPLSILVLCLVAPWIPTMTFAISVPESQTKSTVNLTASSLETNIFLPTLSSDQMSFTKLNRFTEKKKRFKPRLPKEVLPNKATTTQPTITQTIDDVVLEKEVPTDTSSPSPTSLSAKRNFFRRRRKPNIKNTLGNSDEDIQAKEDTITEKSKNETAVDIIMQKIKRAQQFKSGRKFFHSSLGSNKHRKRIIKSRSRFRPPITTDKSIPNTSTAPILATNEKLMRIAANRRKKQVKENQLIKRDEKRKSVDEEQTTTEKTKGTRTTAKRRPFSKQDWSKKTSRPSLLGAKLKAMRDKRKNKYKRFELQKPKDKIVHENNNENEDLNSLSLEVTTENIPNIETETPLPKTPISRKTRLNKYFCQRLP